MGTAQALIIERLKDVFASKPAHLDTLYLDAEDNIRDRHIEHMFEDCFHGRPLDDIFVNNFKLYFEATCGRLLPNPQLPPDEVFGDHHMARAWVTMNFGLIYVGEIKPDSAHRDDPDLDHCLYEAKLRTRLADNVNNTVVAPTALHVVLLSVVDVYRHICNRYHMEQIEAA